MNERLAAAVRTERNSALLFVLLAVIALFVAVAGVYGVVAYSVSQKTREIGIRIALGARHRQVVGHIVRDLVSPLTIGIATGWPLQAAPLMPLRASCSRSNLLMRSLTPRPSWL